MASPTAAQLHNQLQNAVEIVSDELVTSAPVITANFDAYTTSILSDFPDSQANGARAARSRMAAGVGRSTIRALLDPWILAYTHHIVNTPERDPDRGLVRIYDYWFANNIWLVSRVAVYGSWSAGGSNVGNALVHRLTVDKNALNLEAIHQELKTLECVKDANVGGNRFEEEFLLYGNNEAVDALVEGGTGARGRIKAKSGRADASAGSLLRNPNFAVGTYATNPSASTPTVPTSIDGWTMLVAGDFKGDIDIIYQTGQVGDTTPTSLRVDSTVTGTGATVSQALKDDAQISWKRGVPAYLEIPVYRESSADGTLTITLGSKSQAVDLTTLGDDAWNIVKLDLDEDLYYDNWQLEDAQVKMIWTSRTTGSILYSHVLLCEWIFVDGTWVIVSAGSTPSLVNDIYTETDSIASDSVIQRILARGYGVSMPHVPPATQITAAGGRTFTFADANPDTLTVSSGSFISDGYKVGMILTVAGTSSNNGTFPITALTATVLTTSGAFANEGPLSSVATLNAGATITDP